MRCKLLTVWSILSSLPVSFWYQAYLYRSGIKLTCIVLVSSLPVSFWYQAYLYRSGTKLTCIVLVSSLPVSFWYQAYLYRSGIKLTCIVLVSSLPVSFRYIKEVPLALVGREATHEIVEDVKVLLPSTLSRYTALLQHVLRYHRWKHTGNVII